MILVTGSAGYLGSHICKKLLDKNIPFYSIDNLSSGKFENVFRKSFFIKIDYSSKQIKKLLLKKKISIIIHAAAFTFPTESEKNKKKYFVNNIEKTIKFIKYCSEVKIKKFIFFSTSNVYEFDGDAIRSASEKAKIKPKNYYGYTKLYIERFLKKENLFENLIILRIFNIAGFVEKFKYSEYKSRYRRIMPSIVSAINKNKSISIFGYQKKNCFSYATRDYLHIEDFTNLIIKLVNFKRKKNKIYNVGSGICYSLKDLINIFEKKLKKKIKCHLKLLRKGELIYTFCNNNKIIKEIKWYPKKNLNKIISSTIDWSKVKK